MTTTTTHTIDGMDLTITTTECAHCGEQIAHGEGRGQRAWRHTATFDILCASRESCASDSR